MSTHPLFKRYPLTGERTLSDGSKVTVPYHIYDGNILFIGGTADLGAVEALLETEAVVPMRTRDQRALMGIWVCDFQQANLGPHHELQFSLFVTPAQVEPVKAHPFVLLDVMGLHPQMRMLCHGLWNNTEIVVRYNRELLALNAKRTQSTLETNAETFHFSFAEADGAPIFSGHVHASRHQPSDALMQIVGLFGPIKSLQMQSKPWMSMRILNPIGLLPRNAEAEAHTKGDHQVIRAFNPQMDVVRFEHPTYAALGFAPTLVYLMWGTRFIYLEPKTV